MTLRIISASEIVFQGEVSSVTLPGTMGSFTVLPHHAALISTLTAGKVVYATAEGEQEADIEGGIVNVEHDVVSVCIY